MTKDIDYLMRATFIFELAATKVSSTDSTVVFFSFFLSLLLYISGSGPVDHNGSFYVLEVKFLKVY